MGRSKGCATKGDSVIFSLRVLILAVFVCAGSKALAMQFRVLVDQVGYERTATKEALVEGSAGHDPKTFDLIDAGTGTTVLHGDLVSAGNVTGWTGHSFWTAEFSSFQKAGQYKIRVAGGGESAESCVFAIEDDVLERETLSNVVYYFKGQRASGDFGQADRHLAMPGEPGRYIDAHGGWYDATGDYGIHLSHQNPTSYFNPQQVPLVAWSLLKTYRVLEARGDDNFSEFRRRLLDEGLFGADYLVRIHPPGGSFYESISAPGPGKLAKDRAIGNPNWRTKIKTTKSDSTERVAEAVGPHAYESSFRSGGGMAIAALALASTMPQDGEIARAKYLQTAKDAFAFLSEHNREVTNDGVENIVDDYCALLAATELFKATKSDSYRIVAHVRAHQLMDRLTSDGKWHDYWRADGGTRPYFHPSDAGLPVVSLIEYREIAKEEEKKGVLQAVERSLAFELSVTSEVNNPFGYARQLVRRNDGTMRTAFFFPHDTEAAPWWQGENARLASLAAAARMALPLFADRPEFQAQMRRYSWDQLHWILGRNPFDASMLIGSGHNNPAYMFFRSYKYTNAPGAIVNGITGAIDGEDGIAYNQGFNVTGKDDDWRWSEEWLPHAAWYLYAIALPH